MSITASYLERTGRYAREDDKGRKTYGASYRVVVSSSSVGPGEVLMYATNASPDPIPARWSTYQLGSEFDPYSFCQSRDCEQHGEQKTTWYRVRCEWRPLEPGQEQQTGDQENPLSRSVKYWIEHANYSELVEVDKDGKPIVNSCEQQFDEPLEQESSHMVLCAEKNYATLQEIINLNLTYGMKINTDTFHGAGARKCLCYPIQCSQLITEGEYQYYTATFRIEFRDDTWIREIVNRGFKHYDNANDRNLVIAKDDNDIPVNEPILLAPDGTRLPDGEIGEPLEFYVRKEVSFANIGI